MKNNKQIQRFGINIRLNEDERKIIDELFENNVNISQAFKMFAKQYLEKIKKLNSSIEYNKP